MFKANLMVILVIQPYAFLEIEYLCVILDKIFPVIPVKKILIVYWMQFEIKVTHKIVN